jgi:hypothetical protein
MPAVVELHGLQTLRVPKRVDYTLIELEVLAGFYYSNELAHVFEHLMAHWTSTRWPSAVEVNRAIEGTGAESKAETDNYLARYWLHCAPRDAPRLLDILLAAYRDFRVDHSIVQQERNAVVAELAADREDEWHDLEYACDKAIFGDYNPSIDLREGQRLARRAPLRTIVAQKKRYVPSATLLLLAGNLQYLPRGRPIAARPLRPLPPLASVERLPALPHVAWRFDDYGLGALMLRFRSAWTEFALEARAIRLLCIALTEGVTGTLKFRLRSELGLIYKVECDAVLDPLQPALGYVQLSVLASAVVLPRVLRETLAHLRQPIADISAAQRKLALEDKRTCDLTDWAERRAREVIFGQRYAKRVDLALVQRVQRALFRPERLVVAYSSAKRDARMNEVVNQFEREF